MVVSWSRHSPGGLKYLGQRVVKFGVGSPSTKEGASPEAAARQQNPPTPEQSCGTSGDGGWPTPSRAIRRHRARQTERTGLGVKEFSRSISIAALRGTTGE